MSANKCHEGDTVSTAKVRMLQVKGYLCSLPYWFLLCTINGMLAQVPHLCSK